MIELVIDISYKCNSYCKYCQWNKTNHQKGKKDLPLDQLLLLKENIDSLNISRIVLSGGEPTLANHINEIISYYRKFSLPIRLITNGINLDTEKIKYLSKLGIKEFIVSIDAIHYEKYTQLCENSKEIFQKILDNLESLVKIHQNNPSIVSFIGLNVVLTNFNCNWETINQLLSFAEVNNLNLIKFQPVFDDGYLSKKAPELNLTANNIKNIEEIISNFKNNTFQKGFTNPIGFWHDLKNYLRGKTLSPEMCAIGLKTILLHEGKLKFCFWCQHSSYGSLKRIYSPKQVKVIRDNFKKQLKNCQILPQCFCLQPIDHIWT